MPDEAWLVPMGKFCSMKPDKEALPDKAWSAMVWRLSQMRPDAKALPDEAWYGGTARCSLAGIGVEYFILEINQLQ